MRVNAPSEPLSSSPVRMQRRAFALLEALVVVGVIGAVTTLTIPLYREYQIRSDLDNATQQATHGLARAKLLSQLGERDSQWGFYVPAGILYKGESYAGRDTQFDEIYPMPSTIAVSGILEVAYSKVEGLPSDTGNIVLRALNNDQRIIQVTIADDTQALAANEGDTLTVCHHLSGGSTETLLVPDATWPTHQAHGDTLGPCPSASSAASSVVSSATSSAASSAASSAVSSATSSAASSVGGGGGGGGGATCNKFTMASGTITTTATSNVTFKNWLSQITFGAGGPVVSVHACYSTDGGSSFSGLYGGNGNCKGNGNAYGNAVTPAGTDTKTVSIASGKNVVLRVLGRYKQQNWLAFNQLFDSDDGSGHIQMLRNGDTLSSYPGFGTQTPLKNYLISKSMADASGVITIGNCEVLAISELGTLGTSAADFQDDVMVMSFN